jgi:hypothetical protein
MNLTQEIDSVGAVDLDGAEDHVGASLLQRSKRALAPARGFTFASGFRQSTRSQLRYRIFLDD